MVPGSYYGSPTKIIFFGFKFIGTRLYISVAYVASSTIKYSI